MAHKTINLEAIAHECDGCLLDVTLDAVGGVAVTHVPSNGKRGSLHVPAHDVEVILVTADDYLFEWECPACEYANSWTEDEA